MSTGLEGRLEIILTLGERGVASARIHSTRPQVAQTLMAGRTTEQVARLAGIVFSLCGKAQSLAAQTACAAARNETASADAHVAVWAELAREHTWRLLINWPQLAGLAPDPASLLLLRQAGERDAEALATVLDRLLVGRLLGEPAGDWLARDASGLADWIAAGATPVARLFAGLPTDLVDGRDLGVTRLPLLPPLESLGPTGLAELARQALDLPAFCAQPRWGAAPGSSAETGAIGRSQSEPWIREWQAQRGRGSGARMLARLLELARLPQRLRQGAPAPVAAVTLAPGVGAAGVETSRGLLLHAVQLTGDRVGQYRILAPTEWNFHPDGPLAQALQALSAGPELEARARLVAQALDPCVNYGLEVRQGNIHA